MKAALCIVENTDLLDKAKLEKKIASLEGERKSFNRAVGCHPPYKWYR